MRDEEFRRTAARFARFFVEAIPSPWTTHRNGIVSEKRYSNGHTELVGRFDKEMEERWKTFLAEHFPGEHVVSEETPHDWPPKDDVFWIIDPCDGTHNMLLGIPCFGTMAARVEHGMVTFSALYLPARQLYGESGCYVAGYSCGAWEWRLDAPRRLNVSRTNTLDKSWVPFEGSFKKVIRSPLTASLATRVRNTRKISATSWTGFLVASGGNATVGCDAMVTVESSPWDTLPIILLITEAGGVVTDYNGQPPTLSQCANLVLSNGHIHEALLSVIRSEGSVL